MDKYFQPAYPQRNTRGIGSPMSEMCDHRGKDDTHRKTANSKSQQMKHYHQNPSHHYHHSQQNLCHSDDNESHDTHSTADNSIFSDHHSDRQIKLDSDETHHAHSHRYFRKQNHRHVSLSETPLSFPTGSSSTSTRSSSTSTSSSTSSSSFSASSSTSSSSLSSESSSDYIDQYPPKKPQHSQSCTDISRKNKYFEEGDDTAPLIDKSGYLNRPPSKQEVKKTKSSHSGTTQATQKNPQRITRGSGNDGSFRKAKSMETLSRTKEREWDGTDDENVQERRKGEAMKNLMKEKLKFSAFLNEITRQVLSPNRLSTLGVTDARRSSVGTSKVTSTTQKLREQRIRPASADSTSSSKYSHTSKQSSKYSYTSKSGLSHSKSFHHHHGHHSADSPHHMYHKPKSYAEVRCLKRCHSWSQSLHRRSHSPFDKHPHLHQKGDHHTSGHHHYHRQHHSPDYHHGDHYSVTHHHPHDHHMEHCSSAHHHHHHHGNQYSPGHHHHEGHHNSSHHHYHGDHHSPGHPHHHRDHHTLGRFNHHEEHRSPGYHPQQKDHHSLGHHHHHGDRHNSSHHCHHEDHHSPGHHDHHGDHSPGHLHLQKDHHRPSHYHHEDHYSTGHRHHHRDQHSSNHNDHHRDHYSSDHHHHHGDHHSEGHHHTHEENHNPGHHHHHHEDHHGPGHQHHHEDQHSSSHNDHHGDHYSPSHHHHHEDHHNSGHHHHHEDHRGQGNQHHHEDHHSPGHHHQHGDHHNTCHQKGQHSESDVNQPHSRSNDHDHEDLADHSTLLKGHSADSPPSQWKLESLSSSGDSPRNTSIPASLEENRTSFTGSSLQKEKADELGTIMTLQEQNVGLQQSLLKTAVRMECLGEKFMSSQKLLEAELQRTRLELSNLAERFKRLHDNCSSTQQTNHLLEQKLNLMTQRMEGERERLNQRISTLTEKLADAKFADSVETFNVTSLQHKTDLNFELDDGINQVVLPITPPPAQFMDSHNYGKTKTSGQEQSLGSVPEEEESDWSEMGEEAPHFILTGSNRGQAWRLREGDVDKDSESGGDEIIRPHSPRPLQIPHLQFTIHNENLSDGRTAEGTYRITTSSALGSTILIRSASLEEIPLACHHMQKELRGTEAVMDLHHQGDEAIEDLDNEIIHHLRESNERGVAIGRLMESRMCSMASMQSAEEMLNRFICEPQPDGGNDQGRAEVRSWTGGIPDEVLKGDRTQL